MEAHPPIGCNVGEKQAGEEKAFAIFEKVKPLEKYDHNTSKQDF